MPEDRLRNMSCNWRRASQDRKSTRLNSSHLVISYAVFCLKKKNKTILHLRRNVPTTNPYPATAPAVTPRTRPTQPPLTAASFDQPPLLRRRCNQLAKALHR